MQGLIVAAAFIGPGTITTATLVGAKTGYALIWLLVFAVLATYILQEMASRVGRVSGMGLSKAIVSSIPNKWIKGLVGVLIIVAIGIGNAAYEGGNVTGAALGLSANAGGDIRIWATVIGLSAFLLLVSGQYKWVEKTLLALVMLMSAVFLSLMIYLGINSDLFLNGVLFKSSVINNTSLALAIIGTTIVPYNLFLHAGMSAQNAQNKSPQSANNKALFASLGLGGLLTFAVLSSSVSAFFISQTHVDSSNIAAQMQPLLGNYASLFFGIGLFSAGLTSAITAPLATAYAI